MAWANIFDVGEWDVYVRWRGVTEEPNPDSFDYLVRADELDPDVGIVTVTDDGKIVCDFENTNGGGGIQPMIVVMPVGGGAAYQARLTVEDPDELGQGDESWFFEAESVSLAEGQSQEYEVVEGDNFHLYSEAGEPITDWLLPTELPSPIAAGSGLGAARIGAGF